MKLLWNNFKKVILTPSSLWSTLIAMALIGSLFWYFHNSELTIGNLGYTFYYTELALDILITILFGLFVWWSVYKILYFSHFKKKHFWVWAVASFFWILVGWCPACSITIASYLWLASFLAVLPYNGIELKVLSFVLLVWVVYEVLKTLEVCSIKK